MRNARLDLLPLVVRCDRYEEERPTSFGDDGQRLRRLVSHEPLATEVRRRQDDALLSLVCVRAVAQQHALIVAINSHPLLFCPAVSIERMLLRQPR